MTIQQISVFIENQQGRLCEVTKILEKHNIDIRALSLADTTDFGILRIIVDQPDMAKQVLKAGGYMVSINDVIGIGISDKPGGLSKALNCLSEAGVAVEYMYAFISKKSESAYVIFRVENNEAAIDVLRKNDVLVIASEDIDTM